MLRCVLGKLMFYNFLLVLYFIIYIPKAFYEYIFFKKRKKDLLKRIGLKKYSFKSHVKKPIIWIHAVSLGETKAATAILEKLKSEYPNSYIVVSNTTQTGHDEAKKSLILADEFVFFPLDLPYIVKGIFTQIKPDIVIFIETDLWLNFIKEAKKNHAKVIVVSAKISEKSHKRFSKFMFFSKKLFSSIDLILAQNELYKKRFASLIPEERLKICGNLKLVNNIQKQPHESLQAWLSKLNAKDKNIITLASTHDPEEQLIIKEIKDIPNTKILLAPRHPQRFIRVYNQIKKITTCSLLSDLTNKDAKVILIDQMGILNILYQLSHLAIVGGSYISRVGGHNILEPIFVKIPVFFGPFMHNQIELKQIILRANCGRQVKLKDLKPTILKYFQDNFYKQNLINNCTKILDNSQNILEDTIVNLKKLILKP